MIRCRVKVGAIITRSDHSVVIARPVPHGNNFWLADKPDQPPDGGSRLELMVDPRLQSFEPGGVYELEFRRLPDEESP